MALRYPAPLFILPQGWPVCSGMVAGLLRNGGRFAPECRPIYSGIRTKGNEAAMVYVMNAQHCVSGPELITLRNTLFTAITRSRAWVRICGYGSRMLQLQQEADAISKSNYRLAFRIPTAEELAKMRQIHRELTAGERSRMQKATVGLKSFVEALERGDIVMENLPLELRSAVARYFSQADSNEDRERDTN